MDLFSQHTSLTQSSDSPPLAARMAPQEWDDFVGQDHLVSRGSPLRRAIEADRLQSSVFFGPPGCGKTALARLAARRSNAAIEYVNAVTAGVADLRDVMKKARERKKINGQKTMLVVDEIHHFNRSQQDALLPDVERGNIVLIGLTTENPFFYVNSALVSRVTCYEFKPLGPASLSVLFDKTLSSRGRGLGDMNITVLPEAKEHFMRMADGDARRLLNGLEIAALTTPADEKGAIVVDVAAAESSSQRRSIRYDKKGDDHYDVISAFIKSMRGGDPDAALYWMAKMIVAGEDPRFIARRIMICASEDVGNADPQAISVATAAARMVEMVGMPEARIPLAQAVVYIATAPKSNASYVAIDKAIDEVKSGARREVPNHLKDASLDRATLGHGQGYRYPHDYEGHFIEQQYMPEPVQFYRPSDQGAEVSIAQRLKQWRKKQQ